jgi:hypothetical protein
LRLSKNTAVTAKTNDVLNRLAWLLFPSVDLITWIGLEVA